MTLRFQRIEHAGTRLDEHDQCFHIYEYTSHGRREAGNTNQLIGNLQKPATASATELRYKQGAIEEVAQTLFKLLGPTAERWTFVPAPCSKPIGHPDFDDRLHRVLLRLKELRPQIDVRAVLKTTVARERQKHMDVRPSIEDLTTTLEVDGSQLGAPFDQGILFFDDVFTRGTTFKAAQRLLAQIHGVNRVDGMFVARTVPAMPPMMFGQP